MIELFVYNQKGIVDTMIIFTDDAFFCYHNYNLNNAVNVFQCYSQLTFLLFWKANAQKVAGKNMLKNPSSHMLLKLIPTCSLIDLVTVVFIKH